MSGTKRPESMESRLERFFRDNPHEELSVADIMVKLSCSESSALTAISRLRASGWPIVTVTVYRLKTVEEGA